MNNHQISVELVRKELSLILEFEEIRNSQVLSRFIEFVVEKKLSGQEDEIKEYTIAVKGLGKSKDYNPQLDASVRIHAGRLRRILTRYYKETGREDAVVIDIPKGTYVPVFFNRNDQTNGGSPVPVTHEKNGYPARLADEASALRKKPVLAVLPFHNLSADHSKDYFVTGFGEQLSTDMARFQNISVISYFTTSDYKADLKDLQELKEKVHLNYALTGSVRFLNEMMKINFQLIDVENSEIVFTDTFTRHFMPGNDFEIQEEIINHISNIIADDNGVIMNLGHPSPFKKTETIGVQEAIDRYFDYTRDYSVEKFLTAIDALETAVQAGPPNAQAMALLACLYQGQYLIAITEDRALLDRISKLTQSAADLDTFCQQAQKALAWAYLLAGKKEKSFETIQHCIKLNPKASSVIASMAFAYICQGDYMHGFKWLLESTHLTPTPSPITKLCFSLYYFHNGDHAESLRWLERMAPFEIPYLKLLHLSVYGKIYKRKQEAIDEGTLALKEHADNIIGRLVHDEELKNEIMDGLQLAGLSVPQAQAFSEK